MGKSYKSHLKGCARYYPGGEQEETISAGYEARRVHLNYLQNERKAQCWNKHTSLDPTRVCSSVE